MGVINPSIESGYYAIAFAQEQARVLIAGQHLGSMFQAHGDKQMAAAADVRAVHRLMRQIAATQGIDLDESGDGA